MGTDKIQEVQLCWQMCEKVRNQTQEKTVWQEVVKGEGALSPSPQEPGEALDGLPLRR